MEVQLEENHWPKKTLGWERKKALKSVLAKKFF